ncbi:MAG: tetratricopeptide repeat protein, partial [Saprospiraceae bacterium]
MQLIFEDAAPTDSDGDGLFTLHFSQKQYGDPIFYNVILKKGYIIANEDQLNVAKLSKEQLMVMLVTTESYFNEVEIKKQIIIASVSRNYEKEIARLQKDILDKELYIKELEEIQNKYEYLIDRAKITSEHLARINLDDAPLFYQNAINHLESGNLNEAIAVLEKEELIETLKSKKDKHIASYTLEGYTYESYWQIESLIYLAALYDINFEFEKGENIYKTLYELFPNNKIIVFNYALVCHRSARYETAIILYQEAIGLSSDIETEINIYNNLGTLYLDLNNFKNSKESLTKALKLFSFENSDILQISKVSTLNNWGHYYMRVNQLDSALLCLENAIDYSKGENIEKYVPRSLAAVYLNLGDTYRNLDEFEQSEYYYKQSISQYEILSKKSNNLLVNLGTAYNNIGKLYLDYNIDNSAKDYLLKASIIEKKLEDKYSSSITIKLLSIYINLAELYLRVRDLEESELALQKCISMLDHLNYVDMKSSRHEQVTVYNNLGHLYQKQKLYERAEEYYLKSLSIGEELISEDSVIYAGLLSTTYNNIGTLYSEMKDIPQGI